MNAECLRADLVSKQSQELSLNRKNLISCSKGCSNCCYQPVVISVLEGMRLYEALQAENLWNLALRESLQKHADLSFAVPELVALATLACPLLKDSACSVYKSRPFVCQTLVAYGDPHFCHPHRMDADRANLADREGIVSEYLAFEAKSLRARRVQMVLLPLSLAVLVGAKLLEGTLALEDLDSHLMQEYKKKS